MPKVLLFIEGEAPPGGLKEAFRFFFKDLNELLPDGWSFEPIACGGWPNTFKLFELGVEDNPDDFVVMIVDSETAVEKYNLPWAHLHNREEDIPDAKYNNSQCYLMIQAMEAWMLADIKNVESFFGVGFKMDKIRTTKKIEDWRPKELKKQLEAASRDSDEGKYREGMAHRVLRAIKPNVVREALPHCERIFTDIPAAVAKL